MSREVQSEVHCFYGSLLLAASAVVIGLSVPVGHDERRIITVFGVCLVFYAAATLTWVLGQRVTGMMHIANLSVWLSVVFLLEFGVAPFLGFFLELEEADPAFLTALLLVIAGSATFWIGCRVTARRIRVSRFVPHYGRSSGARMNWVVSLFAISILCKLALLSSGVYMYAGDAGKYTASLRYVQWLTIPSNFSFLAVVMICIDAFQPGASGRKKVWALVLVVVTLIFALVSGMKEEVLIVPLLLFIVWRLVRGKANWTVAFVLVLGLIAFYPVNVYYRHGLREEGGTASVSQGANLMARSMSDAANDNSLEEWISLGAESTLNRLDLLSTLHFLVNDADMGELKGDEKLWMVPIYAIVPRFIWHSKPVLDKGTRLSVAMGAGDQTSTAITPFGDLYILGGLSGVLLGMFMVGVLTQACSNLIQGTYDPKRLFIYAVLFRFSAKPELDIFFYCSILLQYLVVALVIGYLVYGGRLFSFSASPQAKLNHPEQTIGEQAGLRADASA